MALKKEASMEVTPTQVKSKLSTVGISSRITEKGDPLRGRLTTAKPSTRISNLFLLQINS